MQQHMLTHRKSLKQSICKMLMHSSVQALSFMIGEMGCDDKIEVLSIDSGTAIRTMRNRTLKPGAHELLCALCMDCCS